MATVDIIRNIFYSGSHAFNGDHDSISEIAFLVDENYLSINTLKISSKNEYMALLNDPKKLENLYEAAGGGNTHVALKILTRGYLELHSR